MIVIGWVSGILMIDQYLYPDPTCGAACQPDVPDIENGEEDNVLKGGAMMTEVDIDRKVLGHLDNVQVLSDHSDTGLAWDLLAHCNRFDRLQLVETVNPAEGEGSNLHDAGHLAEVGMHSGDHLLPSSYSDFMRRRWKRNFEVSTAKEIIPEPELSTLERRNKR